MLNFYQNISKTFKDKNASGSSVDEEVEPFMRDMKKAGEILQDNVSTVETKKAAIAAIGNLAYTGGQNTAAQAAKYLPHLCSAFTVKDNDIYLIPSLKAISQMTIRSRPVKDFFIYHQSALLALVEIIKSKDISASRWACYVLIRLLAGSQKLQAIVKNIINVEDALKAAANKANPWLGWGDNLAENLLIMLRFKEADRLPTR